MDEPRKHAYRYVIYWAMVEIRSIQWFPHRWHDILNPIALKGHCRRVRRSGVIADWMHNLALFSVLDFEHFDEERFWREGRALSQRTPDFDFEHYLAIFEQALQRTESG